MPARLIAQGSFTPPAQQRHTYPILAICCCCCDFHTQGQQQQQQHPLMSGTAQRRKLSHVYVPFGSHSCSTVGISVFGFVQPTAASGSAHVKCTVKWWRSHLGLFLHRQCILHPFGGTRSHFLSKGTISPHLHCSQDPPPPALSPPARKGRRNAKTAEMHRQ